MSNGPLLNFAAVRSTTITQAPSRQSAFSAHPLPGTHTSGRVCLMIVSIASCVVMSWWEIQVIGEHINEGCNGIASLVVVREVDVVNFDMQVQFLVLSGKYVRLVRVLESQVGIVIRGNCFTVRKVDLI